MSEGFVKATRPFKFVYQSGMERKGKNQKIAVKRNRPNLAKVVKPELDA